MLVFYQMLLFTLVEPKASKTADEVRRTSERAMFLATKMQLIIGFQAELIYKQLVMQPEVVKVLEDVTKFRETSERFAVILDREVRRSNQDNSI